MRISDQIARQILDMLEAAGGIAEIGRNELASRVGCVPSQINYVLTSRFTPEQGYIVESRRGGGGYIRITKVRRPRKQALMHLINSVGTALDASSARVIVQNLHGDGLLDDQAAPLFAAALSDTAYKDVPMEARDKLRAAVFKQMLLAVL